MTHEEHQPTADAVTRSASQQANDNTLSRPGLESTNTFTEAPNQPAGLPHIPGVILEQELARGGMGAVYLGRQARLNRLVAVKRMLKANASSTIRFLAEAEAIAAVKHRHVLQVFDSGQADGQPYLTMEYCPGGTLGDKLKSKPKLAPREAAELLAGIAEGVGAAHREGIIHRDLKPGNVLFDADGVPKMADFGLAKRGGGADLTQTQAVMGTPAYMSPEQASGGTKFVGPPADVWAPGVMLYECLCGQRPFEADDVMGLLDQVKSATPADLRSLNRSVPRELELIVKKCLAKDPGERYATANELAADLRNWLAGKPITVRPVGPIAAGWKWARRNPGVSLSLAVAMLAMLAGTGVSLWQAAVARQQEQIARQEAQRADAEAEKARLQAEQIAAQLKESQRLLDLGRLREAEVDYDRNSIQLAIDKLNSIAPENRCVAWGILRRRVDGADLILRGHSSGVTSVAVSGDGRRIVTGSDDKTARVWDAATGQSLLELEGHTDRVTSVAVGLPQEWWTPK